MLLEMVSLPHMKLPYFQTSLPDLNMLQTKWSSVINPVLSLPLSSSLILQGVVLTTGANVVNHKLGRKLQGWIICRQRSAASIYDTQDDNQMPDLTLQLTSSASTMVDILVF
jgi:hypothetical protein